MGPSIRSQTIHRSVRTSDIHEAIAKPGLSSGRWLKRALLSHEPHEIDEECEFEEFARDLLRVLTSHSDALASTEDARTDIIAFFVGCYSKYPYSSFLPGEHDPCGGSPNISQLFPT